jgi:hypothetical protein
MQAFHTRYLGPTNVRGSRIKASAAAGSQTVSYDHALNLEENHKAAAEAFQQKLGWTGQYYGTLQGGSLANGDYVWVMVKTPTGPFISCQTCGKPAGNSTEKETGVCFDCFAAKYKGKV